MVSEKILKLDISNDQSYVYLKCKQYDHNSRRYKLIFTDRNIPIQPKEKDLVTVNMLRAGEKYADTVCTYENGCYYLTFTDNMLSIHGDADMEVTVWDSHSEEEAVIRTMTFHVKIERAMLVQDRIIKSDEYNVLQYLILQANMIPDLLEESLEKLAIIKDLIRQVTKDIEEYRKEFGELTDEVRLLIERLEAYQKVLEEKEAKRQENEDARQTNEAAREVSHQIMKDSTEASEKQTELAKQATQRATEAAIEAERVKAHFIQIEEEEPEEWHPHEWWYQILSTQDGE